MLVAFTLPAFPISDILFWDIQQAVSYSLVRGDLAIRNSKIVPQLLRKLRRKASLTQGEIASALGVPQSMVSKYEAGERRLDIIELRAICELTGISLLDFVRLLEEEISKHETD